MQIFIHNCLISVTSQLVTVKHIRESVMIISGHLAVLIIATTRHHYFKWINSSSWFACEVKMTCEAIIVNHPRNVGTMKLMMKYTCQILKARHVALTSLVWPSSSEQCYRWIHHGLCLLSLAGGWEAQVSGSKMGHFCLAHVAKIHQRS